MKISITRRALAAVSLAFLLFSHNINAQQATTAAAARSASTQSAKQFELTVDSIMRGAALVGYEPTGVRWSQDGARVYFRWKQANEPRLKEFDTYVVNRDGTGLRKLSEEEARNTAPPTGGDLSKDKRWTVFTDEGDIYLYEHARGARRQLTRTTEAELNPRFTRDGRRVLFTRQNNLYALSLEGGLLEQLTDIRVGGGGGGGSARGTESQEVLKKEERTLLEAVRERAERREEQEAKRKAREKRKPFNVPAGQTVASLTLSPDGAYVLAVVNEPAPAAKQTIVPNYVTESAYTEDIPGRTKVGDAQGRTRMYVISVETGESKSVDHGQRAVQSAPVVRTRTEGNSTEQAARERGAPQTQEAQQQTQTQAQGSQAQPTRTTQQQGQQPPRTLETETTAQTSAQEARERDVQLFQLQWSDDGRRAALLARSADNKDRWVLLLDPATAKTRTLAAMHDDAWANGPGAFTLGWLPDNRRVYFESEQDGFAHLYTVSIDEGAQPVQLTRGAFEVSDVRLSEDKTTFYFTSSEVSFAERHLYSMPTSGGARTRLTALPGNNETDISPDERMLAIVRSYSNRPPELYLAASAPMSDARPVTTSPTPEFFTYNWIEPVIVAIRARDGQTIQARLYKPARPNGAAVLFVHGAGYLQNVHRWWSSYYREYMFHHLLMERGFTVLDIDYRGSAGYGRDWRAGIYRHMGDKDLTDHVDAARYLVASHSIDPARIGIYGGSYGGFITLMAMFTTPGVFAAGAALRPVTDWAHYNHPYTSNILNLPQTDLEAYKRSSPIYFAEGLRGALLICHGMVDVNVHFQDSVRLAQRLIELRKENWELAVYPVEDHAFERDTSWADEYKRILKLFDENLRPRVAGAAQTAPPSFDASRR
ncbi:MAG TPA: prolyl oligopeptidase family serine peptidase [Pyrinomonadaceae bacterium]|jgi:dipeptidyl aminopeptidase/acylaminoacyl peptidase